MTTYREYRKSNPITSDLMDEARAATQAKIDAYELAEARKARNLTQADVAERMGVSQKRVSGLENGNLAVVQLDTLQRYIESIGGKLKVSAELPGKTIHLA